MRQRRGIAATLVAFIVFTIILLANSALYSADQSAEYAAILTAAQVEENAYAHILTGISAYDSLDAAQNYLAVHPLDCTDPKPYIADLTTPPEINRAGSENYSISYSTGTLWNYETIPLSFSPLPASFLPVDFRGFTVGMLDVVVTTGIGETYGNGYPNLNTFETQEVHLPVPFTATIAQCQGALTQLNYAMGVIPYCNSTGVAAGLSVASTAPFSAGATAVPSFPTSVINGNTTTISTPCHVDYWASETLYGLEGVDGTYDWTVHGAGSADLTIVTTVQDNSSTTTTTNSTAI